ncbi:hypothetical protein SRHO_G00050690 [Serrasalmus rhombeus]
MFPAAVLGFAVKREFKCMWHRRTLVASLAQPRTGCIIPPGISSAVMRGNMARCEVKDGGCGGPAFLRSGRVMNEGACQWSLVQGWWL